MTSTHQTLAVGFYLTLFPEEISTSPTMVVSLPSPLDGFPEAQPQVQISTPSLAPLALIFPLLLIIKESSRSPTLAVSLVSDKDGAPVAQ